MTFYVRKITFTVDNIYNPKISVIMYYFPLIQLHLIYIRKDINFLTYFKGSISKMLDEIHYKKKNLFRDD